MKYYLVEIYNPEIKFDKNSKIVALTQEVCYNLDKNGIEYSIIEDYYREEDILKIEKENSLLKNSGDFVQKMKELIESRI